MSDVITEPAHAIPPPPPAARAAKGAPKAPREPLKARLKAAARTVLRKWGVDIGLLAASAICFALFAYGSILYDQLSGVSSAIATVKAGIVQRKSSGHTDFVTAGPGTPLMNMDAIWVGKGGSATLALEDGATLTLSEKTLVILKKPFKVHQGAPIEDRVKVVKGEVHVRVRRMQMVVAPPKEQAPEVPDTDKPMNENIEEHQELNPKPNSIIFMRKAGAIDMSFAWPTALTGYLVVRNKDTGRVNFVEIKQDKYAHTAIEQGADYYWQIIDSNRKVILGPFRFELRPLTDDVAAKALKEKATQPIEIYW